jgi:hypothetical protein
MLLYSPFIPVFVLMLRGDITLALGIMLFIYSPLIVAVAAGRSTRKAARPRHPEGPLPAHRALPAKGPPSLPRFFGGAGEDNAAAPPFV